MAITKVAQFLSSPTTTADYEGQNAHVNAFIQQMSNQVLHLTEWATTTVPQIAQGVYLRHAGVLYIVDTGNFDIATGDLSAAGTYYIKLTTSGASLAVAWEDTLTSYAWSIAYQGYYNGTSQLLPYKVEYDTTYTKYSIINMKDSGWNFMSSTGAITVFTNVNATTIKFPATAVPSADANTLDDYEEGNWTPALEGSVTPGNTTYTTQVGRYEKIGRQVTVRGSIVVNSQGTLDGNVSITGLPFTSNSDADTISSVSFGYASSLSITAGYTLTGFINENSTKIVIGIWDATTGVSSLDDAELTDGAILVFSGNYHV